VLQYELYSKSIRLHYIDNHFPFSPSSSSFFLVFLAAGALAIITGGVCVLPDSESGGELVGGHASGRVCGARGIGGAGRVSEQCPWLALSKLKNKMYRIHIITAR
jgi:hypothetical protein